MKENERINKELKKLVSDKMLVTQKIQNCDSKLQDLEHRKAKLIDLPSKDLGGAIEKIRSKWESISKLRVDALKQRDVLIQREKSLLSELAKLDTLSYVFESRLKQILIMAEYAEFNRLSETLAIMKAEIKELQHLTNLPDADKTVVRNATIPRLALISQQEPAKLGDKWQTREE